MLLGLLWGARSLRGCVEQQSSQNGPPAFLQPSHGHRRPSLQDVAAHQELSAHTAGTEQHAEPPAEHTPGEGNGERGCCGLGICWGNARWCGRGRRREGRAALCPPSPQKEGGTAHPAWTVLSGEMRGFLLGGNVNLCLAGLRASSWGAVGASVLL